MITVDVLATRRTLRELDDSLFLWIMCGCYLLGGITIGYYFNSWKNRKSKSGTGRWDRERRR